MCRSITEEQFLLELKKEKGNLQKVLAGLDIGTECGVCWQRTLSLANEELPQASKKESIKKSPTVLSD